MPSQHLAGNHLLDALPTQTRDSLLARSVEPVHLGLGQLLYRSGETASTVHFPTNTVLSLVTLLQDGTAIEVTTIGREGTSATPVFLGSQVKSNTRCICQIAGDAIAVPSDLFRRVVETSPALRDLMNSYIAALLVNVGQGVACSRLHTTDQRCARWLLMTQDRVGRDTFHLTHEFLGFMLGTRRASVTQSLGRLRQANLIHSHRGDIHIIDRTRLLQQSCECYTVITDAMTQVTRTRP